MSLLLKRLKKNCFSSLFEIGEELMKKFPELRKQVSVLYLRLQLYYLSSADNIEESFSSLFEICISAYGGGEG